ncbi:hypothetical protein ACFLS9_01415 [Bacteroidota bacterium]
MKKYFIYSTIVIMILMAGMVWGIVIYKYKLFPYGYIKIAYQYVAQKTLEGNFGPWSIGVYEGSSPFDLHNPPDVSNPVLTGEDVSDIKASFVADPFMVFRNGKYYMFIEVLNRETDQGDIGYAESTDGKHWEYKKIIIDEKFHMSYPYVFEWNNDYYLIPETYQDLSVRLYKAVLFPDKWEYVGNLLSGYRYVDPSIFRYNGKWWLFVTTPPSNVLNLYYSNDLLGEWKAHTMNPIVRFDNNIARPAGRVFTYSNKLYRLAQDSDPYYGIQVFAFEITKLSEKLYSEKIVSEKPLVSKTGKGWNAVGMHHVDLHRIGDKWIAVVDGKNR